MTCEACKDKFSGRPCPYCSPAPVRGLDFEAAGLVWYASLEGRDPKAALNAQVAERIAEVEKVWEERFNASNAIGKVYLRQLQALQPLLAAHREWVEARKAWQNNAYDGATTALLDAEAALAALDLGKEGDK